MPLSTLTITGSWVTPSNGPASGQIIIQPVQEVSGGGYIVAAAPIAATLTNGTISATIVSNTEATALQYQITERITGATAVVYVITPTGSTIDLSTAPRSAVGPVTTYAIDTAVVHLAGTETVTGAKTLTQPTTWTSTNAGGPDTSDSTSRLNMQSYQTNGNNFFGEVERRDLMRVYSKAMSAWRMPRPATGRGTDPIIFDNNASFDSGTTGYSTFGGAALSVSSLQALVGTNSGRIDWTTGNAGTQGIQQTITGLTVGHTYVAYVWCYVESGNPAVHIDIDGSNASTASTTTNGWQELTTSWAATATSHNLRIVNDTAATSGQRVFVDLVYATSNLTGMRSVVWQGAHYAPQDMSVTIHGHWSVEVPDSSDNLQTRFEVLFTDSAGNIGVDQGLVRVVQAAMCVDCNNGNVLRLDAATNVVRALEWTTNSKWGGGTSQRWQLRADSATESGGNAGSNWVLARYNDSGLEQDQPIIVTRSSGRTQIGGTSGTASGLTVNRNAAGNTVLVNNTANGGTGVAATLNDTTSIVVQGAVGAEANPRVKLDMTGKLAFGPGGSTAPDTNLYRSAASQLKTDSALLVGGNVGFYGTTPIARPSVTGSRSGATVTVLTNLLSALNSLGLITDSTTA